MKLQRKERLSSEGILAFSSMRKLHSLECASSMLQNLTTMSSVFVEGSDKVRFGARLQELTRYLISAQEEGYKRLARELHDDIGQRLALLTVEIEITLRENPSVTDGPAGLQFGAILAGIEQLSTDVQHLSHSLHSSNLRFLGLKSALNELCQQVQRQHRMAIDLEIIDITRPIAEDVELCIYRIAQEALRNITKHSAADYVILTMIETGALLLMKVYDNGKGFDPSEVYRGVGLLSIRERLAIVGGTLEVKSEPGKGTLLVAKIPLAIA